MPIYEVTYRSMTATYGPRYIEADSPDEAKRKFARGAFLAKEQPLISAKEITAKDLARICYDSEENKND